VNKVVHLNRFGEAGFDRQRLDIQFPHEKFEQPVPEGQEFVGTVVVASIVLNRRACALAHATNG
jgi:hypothetical protein